MTERIVQFGPSGSLVGTVDDAGGAARAGIGLLLLNAGLVHRVGPHRINVKLARAAAARGVPSLRFDLSGRGDSGPGQRDNDYRAQTVADLRAAVDTLAARTGVTRIAVFGICSGADDGFAAALADPRIGALMLFDPYVFPTLRWRVRLYLSKLRKFGIAGGWERLRELRTARRGNYVDSVRSNYGRQIPPVAEYAAKMRGLVDRGVAIRLVYSGSTVDRRDFDAQTRLLLRRHRLDSKVGAAFVPEVDHVVTSVAAQRCLIEALGAWLDELEGGR